MTIDELCPEPYNCPPEHYAHLQALLVKLQRVEDCFLKDGGHVFLVTSGYRTTRQHNSIYARINAKRKLEKKKPLAVPMFSKHLVGDACDIADPDSALKIWIASNLPLMEELGLYMEAFKYCPGWVHFQQCPPKSLARFFIP